MANIILKNKDGQDVQYNGVHILKVIGADDGQLVGFSDGSSEGTFCLVETTLEDYAEHFEEYKISNDFFLVEGQDMVDARSEAR